MVAEKRTTANAIHKLNYYYDQMGICGFRYNNQQYYYQKNLQGDVIMVYNSNVELMAKYNYDAFGNATVCNPDGTVNTDATFIGNLNPFRYRGYYFDTDSGLYYLQSRYYDPKVGRFLSADSIDYLAPESINGLNLYAYCLNNPVMYYDPTGQFVITATMLGIAFFGFLLIGAIETTFHPIANTIQAIGNGINYLINDVDWQGIGDTISSWFGSSESGGEIVSNSYDDITPYESNYYFAKKGVGYKPKRRGVRVKGKSRKDAEKKAQKRGGGRTPIHHPGSYNKNGKWIGPHYHPNVPNGHPFSHDHYFYILILLGTFFGFYDEE